MLINTLSAINNTNYIKLQIFHLSSYQKSYIMHIDNIIKTLRDRRTSLRVTQETLAEMSGVGLRTLKQIESGSGNPTLATLQRLADVLGMEITLQVKKTDDLS